MWDSFFLVIPVVSSTFASIQTMFKDLEQEDLPWLFIDEAGQAVPQAAIGSIWRSKRVGIVGDPFQIEPVVTIPNTITDNISKYFDLTNQQVNSELSVQSMADRINPFGTNLTINSKKEWIGIPLRVHRRCISPMFEIANSIAYDNTMYNSTQNPKNVSVKFQTKFIDCKGNVEGRHFVPEQAEIIKDILLDEIKSIEDFPDIFVITPFSEVSYKLNTFLFKYLINEIKKYKEIKTEEIGDWLKSHIGTVHTFQGKQAEGVILCLGLDEKSKGAANWASQKPNLLNVAITRAKYRFIAIGDKDIWFNQPYFTQLKVLEKNVGKH
ncbi:Superfamily I DNA and/or RNA helicase (fragment) [Flavobacterium sp. 9AF]